MSPRETFRGSLARCLVDDDAFLGRFYDLFLQSSEEVRLRFASTKMKGQRAMMKNSLLLAADVVESRPEAISHLTERAESHDRYHMNIRPELYEDWLRCLIESAQLSDPLFDDNIAAAWRVVLSHVVGHMVKRY